MWSGLPQMMTVYMPGPCCAKTWLRSVCTWMAMSVTVIIWAITRTVCTCTAEACALAFLASAQWRWASGWLLGAGWSAGVW